MRLTCPTCGAIYEPPEGLLPAAGGHVQCSACHTRWFFRPTRSAPAMTEDQILERLATRHPELRLVPEAAASDGDTDAAALRPGAADGEAPEAETAQLAPEIPAAAEAEPAAVPLRQRRRLDLTGQEADAAGAGKTPASASPGVDAPASQGDAASPMRPAARAPIALGEDAGQRPVHRVEIDAEAGKGAGGSRFSLGFALALLIGTAALGLYHYAGPLADRIPAAAPALEAYAAQVIELRVRVEAGLGPLRDRLTGG
jgi:predicted Zn finger-like uncharacterized protein